VVPCLAWLGREWVQATAAIRERNSVMDSSLLAAFNRVGAHPMLTLLIWGVLFVVTLWVVFRHVRVLPREKAAMLLAISLLLSPYAAGNNFLTVLAIGIIPVFLTRRLLGGLLIGLSNLPFLASRDMVFNWSAYYWTVMLILTWMVLAVIVLRSHPRPAVEPLTTV